MFEISTEDVSIANLEDMANGAVNGSDGVATAIIPPKRRRGRPKGSTKSPAPTLTNSAAPSLAGLPAVNTSANASTTSAKASRAAAIHGELVFDLETVPDYSRLELFGLDPLQCQHFWERGNIWYE